MFDATELCRDAGIEPSELDAWIEAGWIRLSTEAAGRSFSAADVARACLIRDLGGPMGVNQEGIAVILDLVDQIHGLRRALQDLSAAVAGQHAEVRQRIRSEALAIIHLEASPPEE